MRVIVDFEVLVKSGNWSTIRDFKVFVKSGNGPFWGNQRTNSDFKSFWKKPKRKLRFFKLLKKSGNESKIWGNRTKIWGNHKTNWDS